jgi:Mn2+/Fe2+ NRAMP family transporter
MKVNKMIEQFKTPNFWVTIFSLLGILGLISIACGKKEIGLILLAPLFIGGILVMCVVFPILIFANRRNFKKKNKELSILSRKT